MLLFYFVLRTSVNVQALVNLPKATVNTQPSQFTKVGKYNGIMKTSPKHSNTHVIPQKAKVRNRSDASLMSRGPTSIVALFNIKPPRPSLFVDFAKLNWTIPVEIQVELNISDDQANKTIVVGTYIHENIN